MIKAEKKLQKISPTDYNLLTEQDLWPPHYQILLIILLKEFIEFNVNTDIILKHVKLAKLNTNIASAFLNKKIFKDDLIEYRCLHCNKNYQKKV